MWTKGAGGKFTGSTGGRGGGSGSGGDTKRLGGKRGVMARARLRKALANVRDAQRAHSAAKSSGGDTKATRKKLKRSVRAARLHQRETVRVEARGHQPIKLKSRKATAQKPTPELREKRLKRRLAKAKDRYETSKMMQRMTREGEINSRSEASIKQTIRLSGKTVRRLRRSVERISGANRAERIAKRDQAQLAKNAARNSERSSPEFRAGRLKKLQQRLREARDRKDINERARDIAKKEGWNSASYSRPIRLSRSNVRRLKKQVAKLKLGG